MVGKAEIWVERLSACRASGLSAAAFCREQGWSYAQYMYWQRRLGAPTGGLVPVRVVAATPAAESRLSVELTLGSVTAQVRDAAVADVVLLLRGLAC